MPNYTLSVTTPQYFAVGKDVGLLASRIVSVTTGTYQLTGQRVYPRAGSAPTALAAHAAAANPTPNPGGLTAILQGLVLPMYPDNMASMPLDQQKTITDLWDFLRRLMSKLTGQNLALTIINEVGAGIADVRYNKATHTFQKKVLTTNGLNVAVGPWVDWSGDQPVRIPSIVEDLSVDGAGALQDLQVHDTYVLEKGAETTGDVGCGCGGGGIGNTCWFKFTSEYTGGNWTDPVESAPDRYCGTAPAGVGIGIWNYTDPTHAFMWVQGGACTGVADCTPPAAPADPPRPPCDDVALLALNGPTVSLKFSWVGAGSGVWLNVTVTLAWDGVDKWSTPLDPAIFGSFWRAQVSCDVDVLRTPNVSVFKAVLVNSVSGPLTEGFKDAVVTNVVPKGVYATGGGDPTYEVL